MKKNIHRNIQLSIVAIIIIIGVIIIIMATCKVSRWDKKYKNKKSITTEFLIELLNTQRVTHINVFSKRNSNKVSAEIHIVPTLDEYNDNKLYCYDNSDRFYYQYNITDYKTFFLAIKRPEYIEDIASFFSFIRPKEYSQDYLLGLSYKQSGSEY